MSIKSILKKKSLPFFIFAGIVILFLVLINLTQSSQNGKDGAVQPSPTPIVIDDTQTDRDGLVHTPNPTYEAKVRSESFWTKLPYWTDHYKIEYRDSADKLIITLFLSSTANKTQTEARYKNEATEWLRANGAKVDTLKIDYISVQK